MTVGKSTENGKNRTRWRSLLENSAAKREQPLRAITFRQGWRTKARPVQVKCDDGNEYVIKGQQAGRQIINDQIVARLGMAIAAPVGEPKLVDVTELATIEERLSHITPGTAHGTRFIPDCYDEYTLIATSEPDNRPRLARLAVLYGWVTENDGQYLFKKHPPRLIYSVDHGHFFPGGPDWEEEQLLEAPPATLAPCFEECNLNQEEVSGALQALEAVTEGQIIQAVSTPPDQWGLTINERVTLVEFLTRRRQELLAIDRMG
jgi:hypothetical protein